MDFPTSEPSGLELLQNVIEGWSLLIPWKGSSDGTNMLGHTIIKIYINNNINDLFYLHHKTSVPVITYVKAALCSCSLTSI